MKIFVSSVVGGFEPCRAAARRAIETVDASPVMCETFGAKPIPAARLLRRAGGCGQGF
jgi:hypothetical protein